MEIAVSGGGIAGLSIAAVLAQRGHSVRVFERTEGGSMGAGIVCFPNATLILRHFGLEQHLRRVAGTPLTMRRLSSTGAPLGDLPLSVINGTIGAPSYSVLRADLHRLLWQCALKHGAKIETSCVVTGVLGDSILRLADGRQVEADWIIGADGRMNSPLRRYVLGETQPTYGGFVNWIGVARSEEDVFDTHVICDVWGCGERFGVVPITARTAYFAGGAACPIGESRQTSLLPMLRRRFANWPRPVVETLSNAEPESLREIYVHDHEPSDVWHRERVLLVGDAAHAPLPTSGQGACQALEDAFHISELLDQGVDVAPARFFRQFTELRREKANAIIAAGRGFAKMVFASDPESVMRRNEQSRNSDFSNAALRMAALWSLGLATLTPTLPPRPSRIQMS